MRYNKEKLKRFGVTHLYHATFAANLPSIKAHGLGADVPGKIPAWSFSFAGHIYFSVNETYARDFTECAENEDIPEDWFEEIIVLSIPLDEINWDNMSDDENYESVDILDRTYKYKGVIPFSSLSICK